MDMKEGDGYKVGPAATLLWPSRDLPKTQGQRKQQGLWELET